MLFHQLRAIGRNFHDIVLSSPIDNSENSLFRGKRIRPTELRVLFESWVVMVPTVAPYLPSYWRQRLKKWAFWAFSRNVSIQMSLRLVVRPRDNCEVWQDAGNCCRVGMYEFGLGGEVMSWRALGLGWLQILLASLDRWLFDTDTWTCRNELGQELQSKFGIYWKLSIKFIGMNTMPPDVSESYPIEGLKASIQSVCRWTLIRSIMILLPHTHMLAEGHAGLLWLSLNSAWWMTRAPIVRPDVVISSQWDLLHKEPPIVIILPAFKSCLGSVHRHPPRPCLHCQPLSAPTLTLPWYKPWQQNPTAMLVCPWVLYCSVRTLEHEPLYHHAVVWRRFSCI